MFGAYSPPIISLSKVWEVDEGTSRLFFDRSKHGSVALPLNHARIFFARKGKEEKMKKLRFCEDPKDGINGNGSFPKSKAVFDDLKRFGFQPEQAIENNIVQPHRKVGDYNVSGNAIVVSVPDDYYPPFSQATR
jgi:hypothetical protein